MTTGFRFIDAVNWPSGVDLDDLYVRKEYFLEGGLWLIGSNGNAQLGDNTLTQRSSPVQTITGGEIWKQVTCGSYHTAAIKTDGTLWLWGYNPSGALGDNTIVQKSSPVQTIAVGTNWKQVSAGTTHTAAIKTDGTLWNWGINIWGHLGDNTTVSKSSPIQTVAGGANWKQVACGINHTAAVKTDGTLWSWGQNNIGQLGDNTSAHKSSPVQTIAVGTTWKSVACGGTHTAAIKTDGTLWLWGQNGNGQLGDNTAIPKSSPVQTVAGGTNWKQVAGGTYHTAAIKTDGTLWTWGEDADGQLGDAANSMKSSPTQTVSGGNNWKQVACGFNHTIAVKTDGTLWSWGFNAFGTLGDNTALDRSSPVQTVAGGTNWKQVAAGNYFSAATKYDG